MAVKSLFFSCFWRVWLPSPLAGRLGGAVAQPPRSIAGVNPLAAAVADSVGEGLAVSAPMLCGLPPRLPRSRLLIAALGEGGSVPIKRTARHPPPTAHLWGALRHR